MATANVDDFAELETAASALVGRIVIEFGRLDWNLALFLRALYLVGGGEDVTNRLNRTSFAQKLDELPEAIEKASGAEVAHSPAVSEWCGRASQWRVKRNCFVHGRWGFLPAQRLISNVAPGIPGSEPLEQWRFTPEELAQELQHLRKLSKDFATLRRVVGC